MDTERARRRLLDERERLQALRATADLARLDDASERESSAELSAVDQHPGDSGSDAFERTKDHSILAQIETEVVDVDRALTKLEEGTYGACEACGEPITDERLEVLPATRYCVRDQARIERETRAYAREIPHGFF